MKRKLLLRGGLLSMFLLFASLAFAQHAMIKGQVRSTTNEPMSDIVVYLKESAQSARTNDKGVYQIGQVKPGKYTIMTSAVSVKAQSKEIQVKAGQTLDVSFNLSINDQELSEVIVNGARNKYKSTQPSSSLRLNEPLLEVPQNIQILNSHLLADQQVTTMGDGITKNVSGLTRLNHWADLYARVNTRGARMAAFRNGMNVTSNWGPLSEDMSFVDHIEFVKGPAGFLMSNGEPSGIYNVVTKKPTGQDFNGSASIGMGSYNFYRGTLDVDGKANASGKLLYRLNLMGQKKESFRDYEFNNRFSIAPVISYQLTDKTLVTLEYTLQHAKMSDLGSYYAFSTQGYGVLPRDFTTTDPGMEPTKIDDHSAFLMVQHQFNPSWKLTAQGAYFNFQQKGANLWPTIVNTDGTIIRNASIWDAENKSWFGQLFVNGEVKTGQVNHRILAGFDYGDKDYMADWNQYHDLDLATSPFNPFSNSYQVPANGYPQWDRSKSLAERAGPYGTIAQQYSGLYLQDELGFLENRLRLTLAGRFTYVKQSSYGGPQQEARRVTPRIGLSASIDDATSVYGLFDQSFVPQAGFIRNGGDIKPITGNNLEFGIKKDWFGSKWNTTLSVYRIQKNNELTGDPTNTGTESFSVVLGQSEAKGIEFDLKGELFKGMNLIANYAFTDSKVKSTAAGLQGIAAGDRIPGYAKHNINTWFNYKLQSGVLKGAGLSAGFSYQADRDSWSWGGHDGIVKLPNYFRVDGAAFYEFGKVKITANVYNVLDKYLYDGTFTAYTNPTFYSWQVEAPRNYRLNLAYSF